MLKRMLVRWLGLPLLIGMASFCLALDQQPASRAWIDGLAKMPYTQTSPGGHQFLDLVRQDYEQLEFNCSVVRTPMQIGSQSYAHGLGTHSISHIKVVSIDDPIVRFTSWVGVDNNNNTQGGQPSIEFSVNAASNELFRSPVMRRINPALRVDVSTTPVTVLDLKVGDAGDGPGWDHADWAEATIVTRGGKTIRLDQLLLGDTATRYPFSFIYDSRNSDELLDRWPVEQTTTTLDQDRMQRVISWRDPLTGLRVNWEGIQYKDFPALDWVLYFENTGTTDTLIIEEIQALSLGIDTPPLSGPYQLHRTKGAPSNQTDFEPSVVSLGPTDTPTVRMSAEGGRSSNRDFPFFKVETGLGSIIAAVGWSGEWRAQLDAPGDGEHLNMRAGMALTHFKLHPGERVRSPRILMLQWDGDTLESNAQFRQLLYKHYIARFNGQRPLPTPFCNTCFTRGGLWLNETTEQNQISLIKAYAPLGLEALWTDAGWFEGGWPAGAGNWTPRKDNYPNGMAPVAAAAKQNGMIYGLWFEPERVMSGTDLQRNHPDWILPENGSEPPGTNLLNMGLPEARDYFFNIVKGFMALPGFRVYRQDFNMNPLQYWRLNDAPDRQGITEIRYIEGLYEYWNTIAREFPDSLREECASGGRRIDLETIMRMHVHQDSDYWFDNETDQAQNWGVSQYLPNNVIVQHLNRLDDYSFHSTMASSLCLGWIADDPKFDTARGRSLLARYREVRHLLTGAWYPLLPYTRDPAQWMASQYHRPDLDEGLIVVLRHGQSPTGRKTLNLHGLDPKAHYEVTSDRSGAKIRATGVDLMERGFDVDLPSGPSSDLYVYRNMDLKSSVSMRFDLYARND